MSSGVFFTGHFYVYNMANEFVARKGLIVSGSTKITGSIVVDGTVIADAFTGDGSQLYNLPSSSLTLLIESDIFSGDGVTNVYSLSHPYHTSSIFVSVDGLNLLNNVDYTLSGNALTFVVTPPSQSNILVRAFVNSFNGGIGSYTGSFLGNFESASYALTASYALNGGGGGSGIGFPYTGSAGISGSLRVIGPLSMSGDITPSTSDIYNIGSPDLRFKDLYLSGSTIYLGDIQLKSENGAFTVVDENNQATPTIGSFSGSFSGSLVGIATSASFANTASSITFTPPSASYALTASYALNAGSGGSGGSSFPFSGSAVISGSLLVSGNIILTGSNPRIFGDFSSSPISSRPIFQSNFTNGGTSVYAIPNGTNAAANFAVANKSNVDNASIGLMSISATEFRINSSQTGSGAWLPFTIYTSGSEKVRVTTDGNVGIGTNNPVSTLDVDGNVNISGSARRIRGNFTTSSIADRTMFQTNVINGSTIIYAIPNGTGTVTSLVAGNSSAIENASIGTLTAAITTITIQSTRTGTGEYLPLTFQTSGSEKVRVNVDGNVGIGTVTASAKLQVQGNVSASSYTSSISNAVGFLGTASYGVTASYALVSEFAGALPAPFPYTGSAVITGSLIMTGSGSNIFDIYGTAGNLFSVVDGLSGSLMSVNDISGLPILEVFSDDRVVMGTFNRNALVVTGSRVGINKSIPQADLDVSGSVFITGSLGVTGNITGSITTASFATRAVSASFTSTASFALNAGAGSGFPFSGSAIITGSLIVSGSGLRVTGSADVLGTFSATSKSFKIDHQGLPGKKLVYGVLEGPEHAVYARGRLTDINVIYLPEEWKWLIDPNTITVQLTSIGHHQRLYVKKIESNIVFVDIDGIFTSQIDCFYFIQAMRKDITPLQTVE